MSDVPDVPVTRGSLGEVAAAGVRLDTLRVLRDRLARAIDGCAPAELPALSLRLTVVLAEIDELDPPAEKKGTPLDEVRRRREVRAAGADRAGGSGV